MRNLALLPASIVTLIYVGIFVVALPFATLPEPSPWIGLAPSVALLLFLTLWLQDAFLIAEESRPPEARRKTRGWLPFASPLFIVVTAAVTALPPPLSSALKPLALMIAILFYYALIYRAAVALVRAEGKVSGGTPFFNAAFVAWFALAYFPIGVWFVRPRLERLARRTRLAPVGAS